jgi:hypothetical protein
MKIYQCAKCRTVVEGHFVPSPAGVSKCIHEWMEMGSSELWYKFSEHFHCAKCKEILYTNEMPEKYGCPQGEHKWVRYSHRDYASFGIRG